MILNYIQQGGPVMYILTGFSILGLGIILYKCFHFLQLRIWCNNHITEAMNELKQGHVKSSLRILEKQKQPCAKITTAAIKACLNSDYTASDIIAEVRRLGTLELRAMESYTRGLSVIAHLSPLLGLLGTVFGMIAAFMVLENSSGQANPTLLAGGIWEALLTTAFGLSVAIPTLAAFYFFESEVDKVKARMKDSVTQVLVTFNQAAEEKTNLSDSNIAEESYGF